MLAHERSHIRRHDPAVQLLSAIHRALLWHSPLSWFLHRRIVRAAEEASDDAALAVTRDRALYAEVILDFIQRGVRGAGWQGVPMARYGRADKRIDRILDGTVLSRGVTRWSVAAILALGLPLAYLAACARPQTAKKPSPAADAMAVGRKINAGDFHLGRGEYDDAIASYHDGLRLDPTNPEIILKLNNTIKSCQKKEHLLHEGLSCGGTRNVISISPTPNPAISARITAGDAYLRRAEYGNAIASYEEALKRDPFNAEIRYKLNAAIETCKKENAALNEGLKCGAGGPGIAPAAVGVRDIINTIIIRGNVVTPTATVRKSISVNAGEVYDPAKIDHDVTALKNTGYFDDVRVETSHGPMGTIGGSEVIFYVHEKKDAAAKPEAAPVQPAGNPPPAVAAPLSALERETRNKITVGDFHLGRGEYDDAIVSYREGFKLDPSNTILRYKLNRAIETCKKENAALNEGFTCGVGNPTRPTPISIGNRIGRGDSYLGEGKYDDAIASYQEGLKMDPSNAEIRYKLNAAIESCKKENSVLNLGLKCGAGGPAIAPLAVGGPDRITGIIIRGNDRIPASTLRKSISIFPGDIYDPAKIDRDVTALKNTGYFDDVRVETSPGLTGTRGGIVVIFYVHEKKDAATKAFPPQKFFFPWEESPPAAVGALNLSSAPNFAKFVQTPSAPTLDISDPFNIHERQRAAVVIPKARYTPLPQARPQRSRCSVPLSRVRPDPNMKYVVNMDSATVVRSLAPSCDESWYLLPVLRISARRHGS